MMINHYIKPEHTATFAVFVQPRNLLQPDERLIYKHCKKHSHDESNCFEIIGYPARWEVMVAAKDAVEAEEVEMDVKDLVEAEDVRWCMLRRFRSNKHISRRISTEHTRFTTKRVQQIISLLETPKSHYEKH